MALGKTIRLYLMDGLPTGPIAAAAVVITIPIVIFVLLFQRRIVAGLTSGAVKG